jgi:hypothetical protein
MVIFLFTQHKHFWHIQFELSFFVSFVNVIFNLCKKDNAQYQLLNETSREDR